MARDGEILFGPIQEEYKQGIKYLAKFYQEGLLAKEIFTHDRYYFVEKGMKEEKIYGGFISYRAEHIVGKNAAKDEYIIMSPLASEEYEAVWIKKHKNQLDKNRFIVTATNAYPEKTIE